MGAIVIKGVLSTAVADAGTFTVSYPNAGAPELAQPTDEADFYNTQGHELVIGQGNALSAPRYFTVTLGTSNITITNKTGATWAANSAFTLSLELPGRRVFESATDKNNSANKRQMARMAVSNVYRVDLGAPDAPVTNAILAAVNRTNAGTLTINGALVSSGVAVLDRPRALTCKSGGADTAVLTVSGADEYGNGMKEAMTLNGTTSVAGVKAFKTVTDVQCSAAVSNGASIGFGNVLGLPVWLPSAGHIIKELENGTNATAGTVVAGWNTGGAHTATGADVRGTYTPNSTPDADKVFQLLVSLADPGNRGVDQYNG